MASSRSRSSISRSTKQHPTYTTDAYSFSKQVIEEIADYFWRREGISSVNLRLPGVYEVRAERMERWRMFAGRFREAFGEFIALPKEEQRARIERAVAKYDATRPDRAGYHPDVDMRARWRALREDRGSGPALWRVWTQQLLGQHRRARLGPGARKGADRRL